jgi:hypothetical protein
MAVTAEHASAGRRLPALGHSPPSERSPGYGTAWPQVHGSYEVASRLGPLTLSAPPISNLRQPGGRRMPRPSVSGRASKPGRPGKPLAPL